jgi:hypothetical protein
MMAAHAIQGRQVQSVLDEAMATASASTAAAATSIADVPDFCAIYRTDVRPILLLVAKFVRLIKPDWVEAIARAVVVLDGVCK